MAVHKTSLKLRFSKAQSAVLTDPSAALVEVCTEVRVSMDISAQSGAPWTQSDATREAEECSARPQTEIVPKESSPLSCWC